MLWDRLYVEADLLGQGVLGPGTSHALDAGVGIKVMCLNLNFLLQLQIAINDEIYVVGSHSILKQDLILANNPLFNEQYKQLHLDSIPLKLFEDSEIVQENLLSILLYLLYLIKEHMFVISHFYIDQ